MMPLIELKTYKPVCDGCGAVGSTWRGIPEKDIDKSIPDGWILVSHRDYVVNHPGHSIYCADCVQKIKETPDAHL